MGRSQARPAQPRSGPGRSREPDKLPSSNPPAGWAPTAPDTGVVSPGHQGNWRRYARLSGADLADAGQVVGTGLECDGPVSRTDLAEHGVVDAPPLAHQSVPKP